MVSVAELWLHHSCLGSPERSLCHSSIRIEVAPESKAWASLMDELGHSRQALTVKGRELSLLALDSCCCCFSFIPLPFPDEAMRQPLKVLHPLLKTSNIVIGVSCLSVSLAIMLPHFSQQQRGVEGEGWQEKCDMTSVDHHRRDS